MYVADTYNYVIREIAATTHIVTTVAGTGTARFSGDGGPATSATLNSPMGVALDRSNNLYIADSYTNSIRKVSASSKVITTVAGSQSYGYSGDGGPATAAELNYPHGVGVDGAGNLFIADTSNNVIRKVTASNGVISTVAGIWQRGGAGYYSGDGGPATSAQMYWPWDVVVDSAGNLFIADFQNWVIRKVTASSGIITTAFGNGNQGYGSGGDGGAAASASPFYPTSMTFDTKGNFYVADSSWNRIRKVTTASTPPTAQAAAPTFSVSAGTYSGAQTVTITDSTPGAAIYLTMDGSPVSTAKYGYNGPINVASSVTIQAIAVAPGYLTSTPLTAAYTITSSPATVITTIAGSGTSGFTRSRRAGDKCSVYVRHGNCNRQRRQHILFRLQQQRRMDGLG